MLKEAVELSTNGADTSVIACLPAMPKYSEMSGAPKTLDKSDLPASWRMWEVQALGFLGLLTTLGHSGL